MRIRKTRSYDLDATLVVAANARYARLGKREILADTASSLAKNLRPHTLKWACAQFKETTARARCTVVPKGVANSAACTPPTHAPRQG